MSPHRLSSHSRMRHSSASVRRLALMGRAAETAWSWVAMKISRVGLTPWDRLSMAASS